MTRINVTHLKRTEGSAILNEQTTYYLLDRNLNTRSVTIRTLAETKAEALEIARGVLNVAELKEL